LLLLYFHALKAKKRAMKGTKFHPYLNISIACIHYRYIFFLVFVVFGWFEVCFCLLSAHGGHEVNQKGRGGGVGGRLKRSVEH